MEHFTRVLALRYLNNISEDTPHFGYTTAQNIMQYLAQIGYTVEHVNSTMEFLLHKECCEAEVAGQQWGENPDRLRLTPLGRYHVQGLLGSFNYYDAVVIDTPILDQSVRSQIADCQPIERRLERSQIFVSYLMHCVDTLQDTDGRTFLLDCMSRVTRELTGIDAGVKRADQNVGAKRRSQHS